MLASCTLLPNGLPHSVRKPLPAKHLYAPAARPSCTPCRGHYRQSSVYALAARPSPTTCGGHCRQSTITPTNFGCRVPRSATSYGDLSKTRGTTDQPRYFVWSLPCEIHEKRNTTPQTTKHDRTKSTPIKNSRTRVTVQHAVQQSEVQKSFSTLR